MLRLNTILNLILQIPPVEPWAALRISYLLTFTGSTITYLTSVPLVDVDQFPMSAPSPTPDFPASESDGPDASRAMRTLLEFLKTVERGWQAVLRGDAWVSSPESSDHDGSWKSVKVDFAGQVGTTERSVQQLCKTRTGLNLRRIRLKSIIIAGREKILAWARSYGHFTGSRFPEMCRDDDEVDEAGWEAEVLGMWNGTLDMLASGEDQGEDGYA